MSIAEIIGAEYAQKHNIAALCAAATSAAAKERPGDLNIWFAEYFSEEAGGAVDLTEAEEKWVALNGVKEALQAACGSMQKALPDRPREWLSNHFAASELGDGAAPLGPSNTDTHTAKLEEGKTYFLCTCGYSANQPFCDGTHNRVNLEKGTSFAPCSLTPTTTATRAFKGGVEVELVAKPVPDIEDVPPKCSQCAPYREAVEAGRKYMYCACGHTKKQPFCDGTHRAVNEKTGSSFKPEAFVAEADGKVPFCGCRRSKNPPKCDGTHRTLDSATQAQAESSAPVAESTSSSTPAAQESAHKARIAVRGPIYEDVEKGKTYYYCTCGYSRNQPFCDGSHRAINEQYGSNFKPEPYVAEYTGCVSFCGCRASLQGAMCDGSHMNLPSEAGGRELVAYDFVEYTVVGSKAYNHDSQLLTLRSEKGGEPMGTSYHFSVRIGGKSRPYTPVSYDAAKGEVELVVKRVEGGAVSPLLTALKEGDKLEMKGPSPGEYHWKTGVHKTLLLLAGGSGLTPVLQVLQQVCADLQGDASPSTGVHLVFSNKTEADILLREEIARVQEAHPHVVKSVSLCVTRAPGDVPAPLVKGRLTKDLLSQLVPEADIPAAHVLVCGTPEFNKASLAICTALGYASSQVTIC